MASKEVQQGRLPVTPIDSPPRHDATGSADGAPPAIAPVCLVIDDAEVDRTMMRRVLMGLVPAPRILTAASLAEARRMLDRHAVSIVFLDNMLPDGLGADFLREYRANPDWRRAPLVMVSDWPSPFMFAKARAARVLAVWSKEDFTYARVTRVMRDHARAA